MTQHTEGPWQCEPMPHPDRWKGWRVEGPSGTYDGSKLILPHINTLREPDARLIAKAPDRLAALEDLVRSNYDLQLVKPETLETLQEIRAAIAKATE